MVVIVIPVYNRIEFTRQCLYSLQVQTTPAQQIIVVDDGSTDGTSEILLNEFPEVLVLQTPGNLFWTGTINIGIRKALSLGASYVLTMNNDTVASVNMLETMMTSALLNAHALIGALDVSMSTKQPYYGGEIFHWRSGKSDFLLDTLAIQDRKGIHEVNLFPARGLLIPKAVFGCIGLFEEKLLPHYMSDYDFTLRAKRAGFSIYCNYDAKLFTYPEEGGDHKIREAKTLRNYLTHLFGIRGGGNLRNFTVYLWRNCPPKYMAQALVTGYVRRLGGFWIK